ncbi:MAG TPA: plastocyanin/azurin family copper-binding protein [Candidatus Eisenbacteria bacterium]|nr:plastocyanin/azurin family copper-binding protein [Candidatus Eisenbacteria bacterium]
MARRAWLGRALAVSGFVLVLVALAGSVLAATSAVSIVDRTFTPATTTVAVGDTVTWTVTKAIEEPHSVTSGKPGASDVGTAFDSGIKLTKDGDTFSYTFATAGEYDYFCTVHSAQMTGHVTVIAAGTSVAPGSSAAASPAASGAEASPAAVEGVTEHAPVDTTTKIIAAAILGLALVLLFGAAWAYRRVNR